MINAIVDKEVARVLKALGQLHGVKFVADYGVTPGPWTSVVVDFKHNGGRFRQHAKTNRWMTNRQEAVDFVRAAVDALARWSAKVKEELPDVQ